MKERKKIKWKNTLLFSFIFLLMITFCVSLVIIIINIKEKYENAKLIDNINTLVKVEEIKDVEEDINISEGNVLDKTNYYYDYLNVSFMDVDFKVLKNINEEVVGWINVLGAGVNYPYVQTTNNDYYLYHSFDKTKNDYGWIFLDYRNQNSKLDKNTIIYAHGGNSLAMFGPLKRLYDKTDWYNNFSNHYIKISTEKYNYVFKVFSLYVIKTTSDYLKIDFEYLHITDWNELIDILEQMI